MLLFFFVFVVVAAAVFLPLPLPLPPPSLLLHCIVLYHEHCTLIRSMILNIYETVCRGRQKRPLGRSGTLNWLSSAIGICSAECQIMNLSSIFCPHRHTSKIPPFILSKPKSATRPVLRVPTLLKQVYQNGVPLATVGLREINCLVIQSQV